MAKVAGGLWDVGKNATQATEARIHAREYRTADGGLVTTEVVRVRIGKSGLIEFNVSPGPAVMHLVGAGRGVSEEIPLLVPGHDSTLEECVKAAGDADEYSKRELEEMVLEVREAYPLFQAVADRTVEAAGAASASASSAASSARDAGESAEAAGKSSSDAAESARAASTAESNAKDHASEAAQHEVAAQGHATAAAGSAQSAKNDADRAATVAGSTRWVGTQVEVNGKRSPDLMPKLEVSPRGTWVINGVDTGQAARGADGTMTFEELTPAQRESLRGEDGKPGTTSWAGITDKPAVFPPAEHTHSWSGITGKPATFAPSSHTHTSSQVTDAVNDAGASRFGGKVLKGRDSDGKIFYYSAPSEGKELANKEYVDRKANEAMSRPAFFSGQGAPPASIPGARVGDYWLNESTMELHKITAV